MQSCSLLNGPYQRCSLFLPHPCLKQPKLSSMHAGGYSFVYLVKEVSSGKKMVLKKMLIQVMQQSVTYMPKRIEVDISHVIITIYTFHYSTVKYAQSPPCSCVRIRWSYIHWIVHTLRLNASSWISFPEAPIVASLTHRKARFLASM